MTDQKTAAVVVKTGLDERELLAYIDGERISRAQIITITEPERGKYTLVFEGTPEQQTAYRDRLDEEDENLRRAGQAFGQSGALRGRPIRRG